MKNIDNIVIRIESDRPIKNSDELASYWNRGGVVFESLREHGWIDNEGKCFIHFRMDNVICSPKGDRYEAAFNYYKVEENSRILRD